MLQFSHLLPQLQGLLLRNDDEQVNNDKGSLETEDLAYSGFSIIIIVNNNYDTSFLITSIFILIHL